MVLLAVTALITLIAGGVGIDCIKEVFCWRSTSLNNSLTLDQHNFNSINISVHSQLSWLIFPDTSLSLARYIWVGWHSANYQPTDDQVSIRTGVNRAVDWVLTENQSSWQSGVDRDVNQVLIEDWSGVIVDAPSAHDQVYLIYSSKPIL